MTDLQPETTLETDDELYARIFGAPTVEPPPADVVGLGSGLPDTGRITEDEDTYRALFGA